MQSNTSQTYILTIYLGIIQQIIIKYWIICCKPIVTAINKLLCDGCAHRFFMYMNAFVER